MKYKRIKIENEDIINAANEVNAHEHTIRQLSITIHKVRTRLWKLVNQAYPEEQVYKKAVGWDSNKNELMIPTEEEEVND